MTDLLQFQHFHFMRPLWFIGMIVGLLLIKGLIKKDDTTSKWRGIMSKDILNNLTVGGNTKHWFSPTSLSIVIVILMSIVLAGPTWKQQPSPFTEDNSALIIAIDVSETMNQSDVQPSRLARAKQKVLELLELRGDTNTALIAFSGTAHVVMPITKDKEMISHFLDVLESKMMPKIGKFPEKVLPLAGALLNPTKVPGTLLVIGDGTSENSIDKFSTFFDTQQHQMIYWAVGKSIEEINSAEGVNTIPMQLEKLENLASSSNGRLVKMSATNVDVSLVNQYIENNLVILDDAATPWYDSGYPLLYIIIPLYLFWFRKGWTIQW